MPQPPGIIPLVPAPAPGAPGTITKTPVGDIAASRTTDSVTPNTNITLTAVTPGSAGNSINLTITTAGSPSQPLLVNTTGNSIAVILGTDGAGAANSTANAVLAALNGDPDTAALVVVTLPPGSNGTGIMGNFTGFLQGGSSVAAPGVIPQVPATAPDAPEVIPRTQASGPPAPATIDLSPAGAPPPPGIITPV
jgi:hypothetical protein